MCLSPLLGQPFIDGVGLMIAPNIEAMSLGELRYLAFKQGLTKAYSWEREELIDALIELYEELDIEISEGGDSYSTSAQHRYMNSLIEHFSEDTYANLPGIEDLPDNYPETKINLLFKDPYWAHAYWNICPADIQKLDQAYEKYSLFLRVQIHRTKDGKLDAESFEIEIDKCDTSWNVNLIERGRQYSISLNYRDKEGNSGMLSQSEQIETPKCYWNDNLDELNDEKTFTLLFSSLVTKGGQLVESPMLREIVERLDQQIGGSK
jgi:hypothetical protein